MSNPGSDRVQLANYVRFAPHKIQLPDLGLDEDERRRTNMMMLARVLNMRTTVAFVGAGMSAGYKLPSWTGLAEHLLDKTIEEVKSRQREAIQPNPAQPPLPPEAAGALKDLVDYRNRLKRGGRPNNSDPRPPDLPSRSKEDQESVPLAKALGEFVRLLPAEVAPLTCTADIDTIRSETLIFFLGECQKVYARLFPKDPTKFHQEIAKFINERASSEFERRVSREALPGGPAKGVDPIKAMLDLPIERIVTSNYDMLIEKTIERINSTTMLNLDSEGHLIYPERPAVSKSFTQHARYSEELALFTLVRHPDPETTVFHCHGSVLEPETIVASERDYQRWYLSEQERGSSYQQTLELLFGSNPILFIGVSLNDGDLLRQLRVFVAGRPRDEPTRPIFALLRNHPSDHKGEVCERKQRELLEEAALLRERYGVNTIFFDWRDRDEKRYPGLALECMLKEVRSEWQKWWRGWLKKPKLRKVDVYPNSEEKAEIIHEATKTEGTAGDIGRHDADSSEGDARPQETSTPGRRVELSNAYYHYRTNLETNETHAEITPSPELMQIAEDIRRSRIRSAIMRSARKPVSILGSESWNLQNQINVVVILGKSGSGKTWKAHHFINKMREYGRGTFSEPFTGSFYWSSYYANDALTGIDRVIAYIDPDPVGEPPIVEQIRETAVRLVEPPPGARNTDYNALRRRITTFLKSKPGGEGIHFDHLRGRALELIKPKSGAPRSALDGLRSKIVTHLSPHPGPVLPRLERLQRKLQKSHFLMVFDGFERMLQRTETTGVGTLYTHSARRFLDALTKQSSSSVVVLVSQLWPKELGDVNNPPPNVKVVHLEPRPSDNEVWASALASGTPEEGSRLCALLGHHTLAIVLARAVLGPPRDDDAPVTGKASGKPAITINELMFDLSRHSPERRTDEMIRIAMENADAQFGVTGLAQRLLERVANFMSPVVDEIWALCFIDALEDCKSALESRTAGSEGGTASDQLERLRALTASESQNILVRRVLLHELETRLRINKPHPTRAVSLHPLLRNYIHRTVHRSVHADHPHFSLPGYSARTPGLDPGNAAAVAMMDSVLRRIEGQERQLANKLAAAIDDSSDRKALEHSRRVLVRGAYSLIRARMELNTAARWTTYGDYVGRIANLANLVKRVTPSDDFWDFLGRSEQGKLESPDAPLYADELAWLYNELGLALYAEGSTLDAIAVWEQAADINRIVESEDLGGIYRFQSALSLGAAYIQYGRLSVAGTLLNEALTIALRRKDRDGEGRVRGYLAVMSHLHGDLERSRDLYREAIDILHETENARAESLFRKHRADLYISRGEWDAAHTDAEASRALAERGVFPDLVAAARQSLGHLYRVRTDGHRDLAGARREYTATLKIARDIGAKRLESEVYSELSRLSLEAGDAESARRHAMAALSIANHCALGLRQSHALVVLGRATIDSGNVDLGLAYLRHARKLAARQGYWVRCHEAEELLARHGDRSIAGPGNN